MNMQQTLSNLDKILGTSSTQKVVQMSKADFEAHAVAEVGKAKKDAEEEDKKMGAEKARKRLEFLRATTKLLIAKASWEGGNGTAAIPVYEEGFEPPTELPTETQVTTPAAIGGTAAEGVSYAAAGGAQGYQDAGNGGKASGTTMPASGAGTQGDNSFFANGAVGKALGELAGVLKGFEPSTAAAAPTAAAPDYTWPKDLTHPAFLKEGITKRAEDWGVDTEKSSK